MPSSEDLSRRAQLRKERKENQLKAIEQAHEEAQQQAQKPADASACAPVTEPVIVKAGATATAPSVKPVEPAPIIATPAPKKTPAQVRADKDKVKLDQKRATERQAAVDASRTPDTVDFGKLEAQSKPGEPLTLHQLNAIAEKADREVRDEGKAVAEAAAKGAYGAYVQGVEGKRNRHSRMRAQIQAGNAAIEARKTGEQS